MIVLQDADHGAFRPRPRAVDVFLPFPDWVCPFGEADGSVLAVAFPVSNDEDCHVWRVYFLQCSGGNVALQFVADAWAGKRGEKDWISAEACHVNFCYTVHILWRR